MLVRHATTSAVRRAAFPDDEPLDAAGEAAAQALVGALGRGEALCGPSERSRATARLAGLDARVDPALDECDFGSWRGRTLAEVHAESPDDAAAWMTDPSSRPHGGESLEAFAARVGTWLDGQAAEDGRAIAVTHGGVIKAAVVHALGAPLDAFWRVDATPLLTTALHAHEGRWTVARVNAPVVGRDP